MLRRFVLYLLGVGVGCFILFTFFGERMFVTWLPKSIIKEKIKKYPLTVPDTFFETFFKDSADFRGFSEKVREGKINFSESKTKEKPCPIYMVEIEKHRFRKTLLQVCDSAVFIFEIK